MNKISARQLQLLNQIVLEIDDPAQLAGESPMLTRISEAPYEKDEELLYLNRHTWEKAAKLGCDIARFKPFDRGNMETAILAVFTLMDINGYEVSEYKDDISHLYSLLEKNDESATCEWIKTHSNWNS